VAARVGVAVGVGVLVGVDVFAGRGVLVGVALGGCGVFVGVLVGVDVFAGSGVLVAVAVGVAVFAGSGVLVEVAVGGSGVFVGVAVAVLVGGSGVFVGVAVGGSGVLVGVAVGVLVGATLTVVPPANIEYRQPPTVAAPNVLGHVPKVTPALEKAPTFDGSVLYARLLNSEFEALVLYISQYAVLACKVPLAGSVFQWFAWRVPRAVEATRAPGNPPLSAYTASENWLCGALSTAPT
jgi:hypothetical protein